MTFGKRLFDFLSAVILIVILSPIIIRFAFKIYRQKDGPVFYISERMKTPTQSFKLVKFRTMIAEEDTEGGATGGNKDGRVTELGHYMRHKRLDELPQLWNVLRGDLSFVGPRPPLRYFVEKYPDIYTKVLRSRPGVTGLASLIYHRHEEMLLANCSTQDETNTVYERRCVPIKAKLDLLYQRSKNPCLDVWIIYETLSRTFRRKPR